MPATNQTPGCHSFFSPFVTRYIANAAAMIATSTGTHRLAAAIMSSVR